MPRNKIAKKSTPERTSWINNEDAANFRFFKANNQEFVFMNRKAINPKKMMTFV